MGYQARLERNANTKFKVKIADNVYWLNTVEEAVEFVGKNYKDGETVQIDHYPNANNDVHREICVIDMGGVYV